VDALARDPASYCNTLQHAAIYLAKVDALARDPGVLPQPGLVVETCQENGKTYTHTHTLRYTHAENSDAAGILNDTHTYTHIVM